MNANTQTTTETITAEQIRALRNSATTAELTLCCGHALRGDAHALQACVDAINEGRTD